MHRLLVLGALLCLQCKAAADTLLILPFSNTSQDSSLDWIGESIAETVREALSANSVLVLDREDREEALRRLSIRRYATLTRASVIHIAHSLDATNVVYGEFQLTPVEESPDKSRGSLRIAARMFNVRGMRRGPEYEEIGPIEDLASLQNRIAWRTLQFAAPESAPPEEEFRKKQPAGRVDSIESYIRGLLAASPEQKAKLFLHAAQLDARFSEPCFQLGRLYWEKKDYKQAAEWFGKVAQRSATYREARFFLGLSRYYLGYHAAAEAAFQLVGESVPLNEVYNNLGAAQLRRSAVAALENFQRALEGDSTDPDFHFNVGYALWTLGRYYEAAERFRAVLDRDPEDAEAVLMLGKCLKPPSTPPKKRAGKGASGEGEGLERMKHEYEESVFRQLKAALEKK